MKRVRVPNDIEYGVSTTISAPAAETLKAGWEPQDGYGNTTENM